MPEAEPSRDVDGFDLALSILEPVTRQNVALAALRPILARSGGEAARSRLRSWAGELPRSDVDDLFRDRAGDITPEWRLVLAIRQLSIQDADLTPGALATALRDDANGPRLRPRLYRILALRERGGVEPRGEAAELAAAHGRVVAARKLRSYNAIPDPTTFLQELDAEPVNLRGAMRAAWAALDHEQARIDLRLARRDRRTALVTTAGEAGLIAGSMFTAGRLFGELPPREALLSALGAVVAAVGTVTAKEKLQPTRLMQRMDAAVQAKGKAASAASKHDDAVKSFRRHPTRVGDSPTRRR